MTGIAGIIVTAPDLKPSPPIYDRIVEGIRYRGPDGLVQWQDDAAFLVHAHLATVPNPTHTLEDASAHLRCTGDIRLDNRAEIAALCGMGDQSAVSDVQLVIAAYTKFGPTCCEHFIGDFAFAIWDSTTSRLFCARDPFGVRPFFYRAEAGYFAFASDEAALGALSSDPGDDIYIANFLAGIVEYGPETRHSGISRLLGGHWLMWSPDGVEISQYWELTPTKTTGDDPATTFRILFEQAVADRLYGTQAVAPFLSGGMDSSSIAIVASDLRKQAGLPALDTFSFVYPTGSEMDESPYIDAVLEAGAFSPHKQLIEAHAPLGGVEDMIEDQKGPIVAAGMTKSRQLYFIARRAGTKVVLDGHGGDEVVGYGSFRLMDMARKGQWIRLFSLIHTHNKLFETSRLSSWLALYKSHGPKTKFARIILKLGNRLIYLRNPAPPSQGPIWQRILLADFLDRTDLPSRYNNLAVPSAEAYVDEALFNRWPVLSHMMQSSFEMLDKASAVAGVEARYPFFDVRLAAYCVGLPASERLRFGQTRSILRRALKGLLPDKVRLRQTKTSFHPEIIAGLINHHEDLLCDMERDPHNILAPYINNTELHKLIDRLRYDRVNFDGGDAHFLWLLCSFYIWRKSA